VTTPACSTGASLFHEQGRALYDFGRLMGGDDALGFRGRHFQADVGPPQTVNNVSFACDGLSNAA